MDIWTFDLVVLAYRCTISRLPPGTHTQLFDNAAVPNNFHLVQASNRH